MKLCCQIHPVITCNLCGAQWCHDCWFKHPETIDHAKDDALYICPTTGKKVRWLHRPNKDFWSEIGE